MDGQFNTLRAKLNEVKHLSHLYNLAHWDQQVNLGANGFAERGEQLELLAKLKHERLSADSLFELVGNLKTQALNDAEAHVVDRVFEELTRVRKRPEKLVGDIAKQESDTHSAWLHAREQKSFSVAQEALHKMVMLKREYAETIRGELSPYDSLVDDFEYGARSSKIFERFASIKRAVLEIRNRSLVEAPDRGRMISLRLSKNVQEKLFAVLADDMGFDFSRGRLDPTVHPFCVELGSHDIRLTTKFDENDLTLALFGFIHEMGHGLYEQGLKQEWSGTPLGEACSLAFHESQSLIYEKILGLSFGFQKYLSDTLLKLSPADAPSPEKLYSELNSLSINLVRLASDEIGYSLHIILRTELEAALINGTLEVKDLPDAWAAKTKEYFGRTPKDDLEGVLQDVHWYGGAFGYFPHYLGGAMYAAQLMRAFKNANQTIDSLETPEDFKLLLRWLRSNVHIHGRAMHAEDLMEEITGEVMNERHFIEYLNAKYSP